MNCEQQSALGSQPLGRSDISEVCERNKRIAHDGNSHGSDSKQSVRGKKLRKLDPELLEFRSIVQQSCKTNDLQRAMEAYRQAATKGTKIEPQTFYSLLNLCNGIENKCHIGMTRRVSAKMDGDSKLNDQSEPLTEERSIDGDIPTATRIKYAERIHGHMDQLQLPLTESAFYGLVKLYCRSQCTVPKATAILDKAEQVVQCKLRLRLYAPLITAYCEMDNIIAALHIWKRLIKQDLIPSEKEYTAFMRCSTRLGNVPVMERVLSDLAEDVLVPSLETCNVICSWFQSPYAAKGHTCPPLSGKVEQDQNGSIEELLSTIRLPYPEQAPCMGPVQCEHGHGWEISRVIHIDVNTGRLQSGCLAGECLQPVMLTDETFKTIQEMNETIVSEGKLNDDTSGVQGGRKGPKKELDQQSLNERRYHWSVFDSYVRKRCGQRKIDIVIDGANVGYHGKSAGGRPEHVDYYQIDWMIRFFTEQKMSVLMVIHSRHFTKGHMPKQMEPLVRDWIDQEVLYRTPPGMNDDWFWLHAALVSGRGTLVVTNDEMRDHHFQMLAPRYFLRWKDRHQVHFTFGEWQSTTGNYYDKQRKVLLTYPEAYSRRIQRVANGLVIPLVKRSDASVALDNSHVEDENNDSPKDETYVCLRPRAP